MYSTGNELVGATASPGPSRVQSAVKTPSRSHGSRPGQGNGLHGNSAPERNTPYAAPARGGTITVRTCEGSAVASHRQARRRP